MLTSGVPGARVITSRHQTSCSNRISIKASVIATRAAVQLDTPSCVTATTCLVQVDDPCAPLEPAERYLGRLNIPTIMFGAAVLAGVVLNKLKRRAVPSTNSYQYYTPGKNDPFMSELKNLNTVAVQELSPDIIAAARARRRRERANHRLSLEEVELPDNHPFAVKKLVSQEQEAAIKARLGGRPRRLAPGAAGPAGAAREGRTRPRQNHISREQ